MKLEVRRAQLDEFDQATDLINKVFRTSIKEKPTMAEEFPLLLNKSNIDNMIVGVKDQEIVTSVNYLIQDVSIQGNLVKVGFVGGVCTHPQCEGKGFASQVIQFVENKMIEEDVDVISISGTRSLYTRKNYSMVKSFYKYTVNKKPIDLNLSLREFEDRDLDRYIHLYNQNSTKFLRSKNQFKTLLDAATIPWGTYSYKKLSVTKDGDVVGYVVLRIIDEEKRTGKVIEAALDNKYKADVFTAIANKYELEYVICHIHTKDYNNHFEGYDKKELDFQGGTLKVINFEKLMNSLKRYFNQYIEDDLLHSLNFIEENGTYVIEYKKDSVKERYVIKDINELNKLLFENDEKNYEKLRGLKYINKFIKGVFPVDFVWTENLNYQ